MNTLVPETIQARAQAVRVTEDSLIVELMDGRTITVPLVWYPRLWHGRPEERAVFELLADGEYIHWPLLDEDLSVSGILAGRKPRENPETFRQWLQERASKG